MQSSIFKFILFKKNIVYILFIIYLYVLIHEIIFLCS